MDNQLMRDEQAQVTLSLNLRQGGEMAKFHYY
jgi:hypothetical protein